MNPDSSPTICASDIVPVQVEWLWERWLPKGKFVVLDGNPGCGKTTIAIDIVARLSAGLPLPTGNAVEPTASLVLNAEDGADDTIVPRLIAAGANTDLVHVWDFDAFFPSLAHGSGWLRDAIHDLGLGLVVLDPLMAFLGGQIDSHRDQDIRRGLQPLTQASKVTGTTILALRHLRKSPGSAQSMGMGSVGIGGVARSVFIAAPHPHSAGLMVLAPVKNNLSVHPESSLYQIEEKGGQPRISWLGSCDLVADDLVAERAELPSQMDRAIAFLEESLADGPLYCKDVQAGAADANISEATLRRAKKRLGVSSEHIDGRKCWVLHAQHAHV